MHIIVIGAGINGLVAANYLRRAGHDVTALERKGKVGGAVSTASFMHRGKKVVYPNGASVFGFMQDFVFKETGLAKEVRVHLPAHPEVVYFGDENVPCVMHDDARKLSKELRDRWGERGKVGEFARDMQAVVRFLRRGYRRAEVPTLARARKELGAALTRRWITGSAQSLMDHYFTSDRAKLFFSVSATESGPVSLRSPYSAFSIPLMASGSVFGGEWGYVKGGIWQLTAALQRINARLGVRTILSARVTKVSPKQGEVTYVSNGSRRKLRADHIIFATDPLSAAHALGDAKLLRRIKAQRSMGSSGKVVLAFRRPVRWKGDTGAKEFGMAMRLIFAARSMDDMDRMSAKMRSGMTDFIPGYFELYSEGAGDRHMGGRRPYDLVSVFFKNVGLSKRGHQLPDVRKYVESLVLSRIENPRDLIKSVLLTPKDLQGEFFFPGGNIDHTELAEGQTFFQRTYSSDPARDFYRFGAHEGVSYCAAGAYPCGAVAGTPGYMCAQQIIRHKR